MRLDRPSMPRPRHRASMAVVGALGLTIAMVGSVVARMPSPTPPDRAGACPAGTKLPLMSTLPSPAVSSGDTRALAILDIASTFATEHHLRSATVRVTVDGQEVVTFALGESMTGVPATPEMHFRNGAVAMSYIATLLLTLVDDGIVGLDDPIDRWLPDLPRADTVTLRMLASMTSGYVDYVGDDAFVDAVHADPFRRWTNEELVAISTAHPQQFPPGTNWDYSHSGYVILGQALEAATARSLEELLEERVIEPLGLTSTRAHASAAIPEPVLHAYTCERGVWEDSTFWDPSWTLPAGAVQTTDIVDMARTAEGIGSGELLSDGSYAAQVAGMAGFGAPMEGCRACTTLTPARDYGLGVFLRDGWVLQTPAFAGYAAAEAFLPSARIAIAVATTDQPDARLDWQVPANHADGLLQRIAAFLTSADA